MWRRRSVAVNNAPALKLTSSVIRWPATNVWKPRDFRKFWICDQCYRRRTTNLPFNGITTADISHCRSSRNTKAFDRSFIRFASSEANNTGNLSNELPSQEERRRSSTSRRFSNVMDLVQSNVFIAGQRLNDLTGYSGIEALKRDIEQQGRSRLGMRNYHTKRLYRVPSPRHACSTSKIQRGLLSSHWSTLGLTARSE